MPDAPPATARGRRPGPRQDDGSGGPLLVLLAGPNGAGKTTAADRLLTGALAVDTFVNADLIAQELAPLDPERAAVEAGRRMLGRLEALRRSRATFAFETTLAGRAHAPWLRRCLADGYAVHLVFLWLRSADLAVYRVGQRVASGGHAVPEAVVRRRYAAGLRNLFALYRSLATTWTVYDNSGLVPRLVAAGERAATRTVADPGTWARMQEQAGVDG
jgi:predicted ABC-type ATPase